MATKTASAKSALGTIEQFIAEVGPRTKKAAEANTEAGGYDGQTEHPVKNVDDRTEPAKEGERSSENEKDVKEEQGAPGVNSTAEAVAKTGSSPLLRLARGRNKKAEGAVSSEGSAPDDAEPSVLDPQPTGKTPDLETNSAKAGKEDKKEGDRGGTSHPASTENDSLDGHKYAADADPIKLAADVKMLGDDLLANLTWLADELGMTPKSAVAAAPAPGATKQAAAPVVVSDPNIQAQLGWELAALVNGTMDKTAADAMVHNAVVEVIKQARQDALNVADYYDQFFASAQAAHKQAAGGEEGGVMPQDPSQAGGDPAAGGMPPGAGQPGEEQMMSALGGGMPADGGGGGGGLGDGMGEGAGGGADANDPEVMQLAQFLAQQGITLDDLEQALQQEGGGEGGEGGGEDPAAAGGMPGGDMAGAAGGGAPPPLTADKAARDKAAVAKKGNYSNPMLAHVQELIQRSRRRSA